MLMTRWKVNPLCFFYRQGGSKMEQQVYLTAEGKKQLEDKLDLYKTVKRPEVIKRIGLAREFGDLSENAEYDAAKEEQARIESEITEMETKLRNCVIIKKVDVTKVNIGWFVELLNKNLGQVVKYKIVGSTESNPLAGLISNESPVGSAVLGKKVGDEVTVETPAGHIIFEIKNITNK